MNHSNQWILEFVINITEFMSVIVLNATGNYLLIQYDLPLLSYV